MKIDISSIKKNIGDKLTIKIVIPKEDIKLTTDRKITFNSSLNFNGEAINIGKSILITGTIQISLFLNCDRCLNNYSTNLSIPYSENFSFDNDSENKNLNEITEDSIDLWKSVNSEILLSLPMKALCNKNCKGICQVCGINLNNTSCNCNTEDIDPRLSILKELKLDENDDE